MISSSGPDVQVRIRFEPGVAGNVAEVHWHKTQRVKFNRDGSLDFRARVSGIDEIAWWILGYGDQAEVLAPPELRERIAGHAGGWRRGSETAGRHERAAAGRRRRTLSPTRS